MAEPTAQMTTLPDIQEDGAPATEAQLTKLRDAATREYSLKNYAAAAELYSEATEIQAELHGEMNPSNADLLYAYGRCLYHVAVSKSDVLGGKVASSEEPAKKKRKTKATKDGAKSGEEKLAEDVVEAAVEEKDSESAGGKAAEAANKPFFQITGDENWTDSEDEDEDGEDGAGGEGDEEDDDFAIAYEILDVARVLLSRKLESLSQTHEGKGKAKETPPEQTPEGRQIMERLADTHDLQAEISLENERFADAVADEKASLELKLRLFPPENSLVAEAHYKLSLALEFASVTQTQAEGEAVEAPAEATSQVDEEMRKEAVSHMEAAIESCKLRVAKEQQSLPSLSPEQAKEKQRSIKDVTEMIGDMEQRLIDLRDPSVSLNGGGPAGAGQDGGNPLGGILGSILGESAADQKARIAEATKTANDLTGLIKHKKKKPATTTTVEEEKATAAAVDSSNSNGKRKAEEDQTAEERETGKKVKFADDQKDV